MELINKIGARLKLMLICLAMFFNLSSANSQKKYDKEKEKILGEGFALYTLILANWMSNDLYYENEFNTRIVKGYLSYKGNKDSLVTIFWREIDTLSAEYKAKNFTQVGDTGILATKKVVKDLERRVIVKEFAYAHMQAKQSNAHIIEEERAPTDFEKMLMDYRAMVYKEMNSDTIFFKHYKEVQLKAIPFDAGKEIKVFVYSTTLHEGVIPFGGDYLLVYDKKEKKLKTKIDYHKELVFLPTKYKGKQYDASKAADHVHVEGASELITPTDIATLLLYKSRLEWDELHVLSKKSTSIFTLIDKKLVIVPTMQFEARKKMQRAAEVKEENSKMH